MLRWAQNPRSRLAGVSRRATGAGHRPGQRAAAARRDGRGRRPAAGAGAFKPPAGRGGRLAGAARALAERCASAAPGPPTWRAGAALVPAAPGAPARRRRACAGPTWTQLARIAARLRAAASASSTELTLDPPEATSDEAGAPQRDEDYLILSTIHSAKGQEWNAVHVLNVVDGCMPSDMATGTRGRDRGRAPPALRGDDARQAAPAAAGAAALPRHAAGGVRRPASVRAGSPASSRRRWRNVSNGYARRGPSRLRRGKARPPARPHSTCRRGCVRPGIDAAFQNAPFSPTSRGRATAVARSQRDCPLRCSRRRVEPMARAWRWCPGRAAAVGSRATGGAAARPSRAGGRPARR